MNVAFFVSAHGFGHAARVTAIMAAIRRRVPDCDLEVFTQLPGRFFSETLEGPFRHHPMITDVGMIQKDPFVADIPATLAALGDFLPFSKTVVQDIATGLIARGCDAVVCDISPLGIAVAKAAGIPSVLVENFTWDWLYEPYLKAYPAIGSHMEILRAWFSKADVHLQTEPVCRAATGATRLHPISRLPKQTADATRTELGVSRSRPLVLVSTGGVAFRHRFLEYLEKKPDVNFVIPHNVIKASRRGNMIILPHYSAFYHPDLVSAVDAVVGKLGYSTLAEVGHAGKPFGYILRKESGETKILADYAAQHVSGRAFSEEDFLSGRWLESIEMLLEMTSGNPAFPNDADRAASYIVAAASRTQRGKAATTVPIVGNTSA